MDFLFPLSSSLLFNIFSSIFDDSSSHLVTKIVKLFSTLIRLERSLKVHIIIAKSNHKIDTILEEYDISPQIYKYLNS